MAHATTTRRSAGRRPVSPARKLGNWKLAYADFLTALCAFFLLMWMVSGTSSEERSEIARAFRGDAPLPAAAALPQTPHESDRLFAALTLNETLKAAGDSLVLTETPDGLRIDLIDQANRPLFQSGDGTFTPEGVQLATAVAVSLASFPQSLTIEGHTDAFIGAPDSSTNWDLSAARALEARRILTANGVEPARIRAVTGLADTAPLASGQPHLASNRRVSLLIHSGT